MADRGNLDPHQEPATCCALSSKLPRLVDNMSNAQLKVLICGHDLKFLTPFIRRLESSTLYQVRILLHPGHKIANDIEAVEALEWADVIFCEWALGNAAWFSQHKRPDQVLLVRLHLQEVQAKDRINFIWETNWSNVDRLILITHHVYDWMRAEFDILRRRAALIYNPIPAFATLNQPKSPETRFVLGLVGVVPARKRLDMAVQLLKLLRKRDNRYILRVKGSLPSDYPWMAQRRDEMAWYDAVFEDLRELRESGGVIFDPHSPDMAAWYKEVGHILSVSDFEGSHQAVAEGMATGCIPAIRDWEGADRIYPAHYVNTSLERMAEKILHYSDLAAFAEQSEICRRFAQERFDEGRICDASESILTHEAMRIGRLAKNWQPLLKTLLHTPTVLIVAYIPIGSRSGYRIRVEQEIQALAMQGCIVHLVSLVPESKNSLTPEASHALAEQTHLHCGEFEAMGCTASVLPISDFFRMHFDDNSFPEVTTALCNLITQHRVDIVHAEALYCARVAATVKSRLPDVLFSVDWHGVVPEESRMGGAHPNRVAALESAEKLLLDRTDLNVFVSQAMATHYRTKYPGAGGANVIVPCCVSDERLVEFTSWPKHEALAEPLVFGYAGTMADWQCGQEMLILFAALHQFDSSIKFKLLVPTADHAKVLSFAAEAGLPSDGYILMSVAHDEVPAHLATMDIAFLLRRDDPVNRVSSPTKFGEYLAAGTPVVLTECIGDFSEIAKESGLGFIVPSAMLGPEDLRQPKLLQSICDFAMTVRKDSSMRQRCQALARRELQWEPAAIRWLNKIAIA